MLVLERKFSYNLHLIMGNISVENIKAVMVKEAGGCGVPEKKEANLRFEFHGHLGYFQIAK